MIIMVEISEANLLKNCTLRLLFLIYFHLMLLSTFLSTSVYIDSPLTVTTAHLDFYFITLYITSGTFQIHILIISVYTSIICICIV